MSTHNICFHREIRKILCGYPLLSVAMIQLTLVASQELMLLQAPPLLSNYLGTVNISSRGVTLLSH